MEIKWNMKYSASSKEGRKREKKEDKLERNSKIVD